MRIKYWNAPLNSQPSGFKMTFCADLLLYVSLAHLRLKGFDSLLLSHLGLSAGFWECFFVFSPPPLALLSPEMRTTHISSQGQLIQNSGWGCWFKTHIRRLAAVTASHLGWVVRVPDAAWQSSSSLSLPKNNNIKGTRKANQIAAITTQGVHEIISRWVTKR